MAAVVVLIYISRQDAQLSKDILSGSHTWYFEALEWLDIEFHERNRR